MTGNAGARSAQLFSRFSGAAAVGTVRVPGMRARTILVQVPVSRISHSMS